MPGCIRCLSLVALLSCGLGTAAAQPYWFERPAPYVPARPPSKQDIDRRESLKYYVLGLLCVREDRLLEAVEAYEKAAKLDPKAGPVFKALVPFYIALDRLQEALAASQKALELDPDDYESWHLYARQLKSVGRAKEAVAALTRGLGVAGIKDHPEVAQPMYLLLGQLHENSEAYVAAAAAYTEAAKVLDNPDLLLEIAPVSRETLAMRAGEIYERVGRMFLQAGKYDQAVTAYREAQKCFPDGAGRLNFNLAQVSQKQGNLSQALAYIDAYLRLQPQGLEAYDLKIKLLEKLGRDKEILTWLEQASKADSFNVGLKMLLARNYVQAKESMQAEKLYQELAAKAPSAEVYRGLFRLYRDEPRLGLVKALALLNRTLEQAKTKEPAPDNPALAQSDAMIGALREDGELARDLVQVAYRQIDRDTTLKFHTVHLLAVLADRNRQLEQAEGFYRQGLLSATPNTEALLYSGLLRVLWKARKYEAVIQVCRDGLRQSQATLHVLFHGDLARALARMGKTDQALAEADLGLNLAADPERLSFRHLRVRILTLAERFEKAEAECLALLKEFPQPGEVLETRYMLSNVYSAARSFPKAEEQLGLVLKIDPSNATANNDLGYIWADQGKNLKEAEELIRKAIDLDRRQRKNVRAEAAQENAAYIDSLGWVLFRRGQVEAARRELQRATALPDGDDPTIWDHLGDVYYRLRLTNQARSAWRQALTLYEREKVRTMDQRHKDLQRKIKLLDTARQP